jgi:hypothetical protein
MSVVNLQLKSMSASASLRLKYLLPLICLLLTHTIQAQTTIPPAVKFDEFGDIAASDLIARLDSLAVALQNDPTARAFIIVYRTRRDLRGLSNRYAHRMKSYLVDSRGMEAARIVTVDGGAAECLTQELWIVPLGATPKPRADADADVYSFSDSAYKFDQHYYHLPPAPIYSSYWSVAPDALNAYLEAFAVVLRKEPRADAYLIAYKSAQFDRPSLARTMLRREKDFLVKHLGIKSSRIKTVDGGYRKWREMELWIVPHGEYAPFASPVRVAKSRRRQI